MLNASEAIATIPAQDLERAKSFYADKLGLKPIVEREAEVRYSVGGSEFVVFQSTGKASGDHTQLGFTVDDLETTMSRLRETGVVFEEYDSPHFKSVDGIVDMGGNEKGAWFKDSEGNLLALAQRME